MIRMGLFVNDEVIKLANDALLIDALLTENSVVMKNVGEPIRIFCGGQSTTSHKIPRVKVGYNSSKEVDFVIPYDNEKPITFNIDNQKTHDKNFKKYTNGAKIAIVEFLYTNRDLIVQHYQYENLNDYNELKNRAANFKPDPKNEDEVVKLIKLL